MQYLNFYDQINLYSKLKFCKKFSFDYNDFTQILHEFFAVFK